MRKYTQLGLVLLTVISISVLLMYRNEYKQLKYVLEVVNFIGRKDELDLVRLENRSILHQSSPYEFASPLPIWQRIGNGFHAYSSFWIKQSLKSGGEIVTIAVGLKHSIVSFKCDVIYANNKYQKAKFVFVREEGANTPSKLPTNDSFIVYKFVCKVAKDLGLPEKVVFTDSNTKSTHVVRVRNLETKHIKELHTMAVCADLLPTTNETYIDPFLSEFNLLQFFFHHHFIGVDEFIIYDTGLMTPSIQNVLLRNGIKVNVFPYNFPFELGHNQKTRKIIELDCLLRTSNSVKYTSILTPRDYMYPNAHLRSPTSFLRNLNPLYESDGRFEIKSNDVCAHRSRKIFSDNLLSNTDVNSNSSSDYKINLYRPSYLVSNINSLEAGNGLSKMHLNRNEVFNNRYINCDEDTSTGKNSVNNLQKWRSTIPSEFVMFIDQIAVEINAALRGAAPKF